MTASYLPGDSASLRKARGAFFTPPGIADFLAGWAVAGRKAATVLDPTCGEGVFLSAAAHRLASAGTPGGEISQQLHGVDLHGESLNETRRLLGEDNFGATLLSGDFFDQLGPTQLGTELPWMDAVIGNPPFVRYQEHRGEARKRSLAAALTQGVRLSGLASSWAALLVHACSFLKREGRVAMVVPAELLTVGYAEPIRRWLRERFASVHLVLFERLQFAAAEEQVVLLVARGSGGCDALALHQVRDAEELQRLHVFDGTAVAPRAEGKWTDLLLPADSRRLFKRLTTEHFSPLGDYGSPELGTVTGANDFFALSESTRLDYRLDTRHLTRIVPPGTRHLRGSTFTRGRWEQLRLEGHRVWLLNPATRKPTAGLARYIKAGERRGIPTAYKCSVREPWWKPPAVSAPDLFFTYMSHRLPRLISNSAGATFVNSMHGVRLRSGAPPGLRSALPLLALNSLTALGAELHGRSYGGGILKMEPREAGLLPVPNRELLIRAWDQLEPRKEKLDDLVRSAAWEVVIAQVDAALLSQAAGLSTNELLAIRDAGSLLRKRRTRQDR